MIALFADIVNRIVKLYISCYTYLLTEKRFGLGPSSVSYVFAIGVAEHVAGVKGSRDMSHDSDLIPEEIC